jgi:hypothetical protein
MSSITVSACTDQLFSCGYAKDAAPNCRNASQTFRISEDYVMNFQMLPSLDGTCKVAPNGSNCMSLDQIENGTLSAAPNASKQSSQQNRTESIAIGVSLGTALAIALICIILLIRLLLHKKKEVRDLMREHSAATVKDRGEIPESDFVFELHSREAPLELPETNQPTNLSRQQ